MHLNGGFPFTSHDLRHGPLEICRAFVSRRFSRVLLLVDLCFQEFFEPAECLDEAT